MRPFILIAAIWLSLLSFFVLWPIVGAAPWEAKQDDTRGLLCEDALTRRRDSERALAALGRERLQAVIDAKRLAEIEVEARDDIGRYCGA